jgi:hypothetical protein
MENLSAQAVKNKDERDSQCEALRDRKEDVYRFNTAGALYGVYVH